VKRAFVGRGLKSEMGRRLELEGLGLEWASGSVVWRGLDAPRDEAARRGQEPHPLRSELQGRAEAGSMAGWRRVGRLGFVAVWRRERPRP
jgi:hypothetical protein